MLRPGNLSPAKPFMRREQPARFDGNTSKSENRGFCVLPQEKKIIRPPLFAARIPGDASPATTWRAGRGRRYATDARQGAQRRTE